MKQIDLDSPEKRFHKEIDAIVATGTDYVDAVITWCNKNNIELEFAATLIRGSSTTKSKFKKAAETLNFLKKE